MRALLRGVPGFRLRSAVLRGSVGIVCLFAVTVYGGDRVIAQVFPAGPIGRVGVPIYGSFRSAAGEEYLLVRGARSDVSALGLRVTVLTADDEQTHLAAVHDPAGRWRDDPRIRVVLRDGTRLVVVTADFQALEEQQLDFQSLEEPLRWPEAAQVRASVPTSWQAMTYDARMAGILDRVRQTNLYAFIRDLSGELPLAAQGDVNRVTSRHTLLAAPLRNALEYAAEHFQGLGLATTYHGWTNGAYNGRNLIATLPGSGLATQIVILCAHVDAMPGGTRNYGADDNASGSAAVLAAAAALRHVTLDRTVRLCLFTGEEQGLLGSARYAQKASADGDHIVAVFNADMIGWDSTGGPVLNIFTRTTLNPGYAGDRAIADVFTNVVATYEPGLLTPVIVASGLSASDHSSFWTYGYPAVLGIEDDDGGDFCAFYHTINDRLSTLNLDYLTAYAKAIAGTVAHLAGIATNADFDAIEVGLADWQGATNGAGIFVSRHQNGAVEGLDSLDLAWTNAPAGTNAVRYRVATTVGGTDLKFDARPFDSTSIVSGWFTVLGPTGTVFAASPQVRILHDGSLAAQKLYHARIVLDAAYAGAEWRCVTNVRDVVRQGGYLPVPALQNLTNGAVIGTFELAAGLVETNAAAFPLALKHGSNGVTTIALPVQPGTTVFDTTEATTNLANGAAWIAQSVVTNGVDVTEATFTGGTTTVHSAFPTDGSAQSFRIRRAWRPIAPGD